MLIYKGFNSIDELLDKVGKKGIKKRKLDNCFIVKFQDMYYLVGYENVYKYLIIGKELVWYKYNGCCIKVKFDVFKMPYKINEDIFVTMPVYTTYTDLLEADNNVELYGLYEYALNGNINKMPLLKYKHILSLLAATFHYDEFYTKDQLDDLDKYFDKNVIEMYKQVFDIEIPPTLIGINPFVSLGLFKYKNKTTVRRFRERREKETDELIGIMPERFWEYWQDRF